MKLTGLLCNVNKFTALKQVGSFCLYLAKTILTNTLLLFETTSVLVFNSGTAESDAKLSPAHFITPTMFNIGMKFFFFCFYRCVNSGESLTN